jgi:hypothetical protein
MVTGVSSEETLDVVLPTAEIAARAMGAVKRTTAIPMATLVIRATVAPRGDGRQEDFRSDDRFDFLPKLGDLGRLIDVLLADVDPAGCRIQGSMTASQGEPGAQ